MGTPHADDQTLVRPDPERHVVLDEIRANSLRIQVERPTHVLIASQTRDGSGQSDRRSQHRRLLNPVNILVRHGIWARSGSLWNPDRFWSSVPKSVAWPNDFGVAVDADVRGARSDMGDPTCMVVVTAAEHKDVGCVEVDAERVGDGLQRRSLPSIEEDTLALSLYPQRHTMLGGKAFAGFVIYQDRDPRPSLVSLSAMWSPRISEPLSDQSR